jgi:monofunctional biosynthetic peptidoglycan transglycosylase
MRPAPRWLKYGLAAVFGLLLLWQSWYLGWVIWWKWANPSRPRASRASAWRSAPEESQGRTQAPVAALREDFHPPQARRDCRRGRQVRGPRGLRLGGHPESLEKNQKQGKVVAGGSTISQQLAKNLLLSPTKSFLRKGEEAIITVWIELLWDKRRILEVYLNVVEWGDGVFGAEAAARRYFGISASQLGAEQAARLAVMLPAPRRYERNPYSAYMNGRTELILGRMGNAFVP